MRSPGKVAQQSPGLWKMSTTWHKFQANAPIVVLLLDPSTPGTFLRSANGVLMHACILSIGFSLAHSPNAFVALKVLDDRHHRSPDFVVKHPSSRLLMRTGSRRYAQLNPEIVTCLQNWWRVHRYIFLRPTDCLNLQASRTGCRVWPPNILDRFRRKQKMVSSGPGPKK